MKSIVFVLLLSYSISQDLTTQMENLKFMNHLYEDEILKIEEIADIELIDVRCFWVNGFNVYDISNLERSN